MAKKIVINQTSQQSLEVKTLKYPNGTYVGEVEGDSIANGKGTMTFNDGNKYEENSKTVNIMVWEIL